MYYEIFQRERCAGFHYVAAAFWDSREAFVRDKPPRLINDFKMQLHVRHQQIALGPRGGRLHVSGAEVFAHELRSFQASEALQWERDQLGRIVTDRRGRWVPRRGSPLAPFLLRGSRHDPQWQRDRFSLCAEDQVARNLIDYSRRAERLGWEGDRRGTTLNLQVGASADDGYVESLSFWDTASSIKVGSGAQNAWHRFTGVSGLAGQTISSAVFSLNGDSPPYDGFPESDIYAELAASPAAPTDVADYNGKTPTTAVVAWDSSPPLQTGVFVDSPSIVSVIQELADAYNPTAIQILHRDSGPGGPNYHHSTSYDGDTSAAAKLTIDYSGAAPPPFTPPRPQRRSIYRR